MHKKGFLFELNPGKHCRQITNEADGANVASGTSGTPGTFGTN